MKANKTKIIVRFVGTFFSIVTVVSVGLLLLVPELRFWEPESEAAGFCPNYMSYSYGACSNTQCSQSLGGNLGNRCGGTNPKSGGPKVTRCLIRTERDNIVDCCQYGNPSSTGVCPPAPTGTPTPTQTMCSNYGTYPRGTCNNTDICPSGRACATRALIGASDRKCLSRSTYETIADCCPAGQVISSNGTSCVQPTQTGTPSPTQMPCSNYGTYPRGTCTNTNLCPSGRVCEVRELTGASDRKCLSRSTYDTIADCCPAGKILNSARTACVSSVTATTPPPTSTGTPNPTNTGTPNPTNTGTPNPTGTATTTITTTVTNTGTPSGTGPVTITVTEIASTTIPPVTTVDRTPSVTHTPTDTGFAEDILLYLGGVLYGVGVLAFIYARTMTRKVGSQSAG